jgi:hypothetical protein
MKRQSVWKDAVLSSVFEDQYTSEKFTVDDSNSMVIFKKTISTIIRQLSLVINLKKQYSIPVSLTQFHARLWKHITNARKRTKTPTTFLSR